MCVEVAVVRGTGRVAGAAAVDERDFGRSTAQP